MRFFLFSLSSFFVIILASFFVPPITLENELKPKTVLGETSESVLKNIPMLSITSSFPVLSANNVYAVDVESGISLYEKSPNQKVLPASTTKMITALVALDSYRLDDVFTVNVGNVEGQKMGLAKGERIKVMDLLYGLLIYSANDAAEQFALNYPGGRDSFIEAMNAKSYEIGMKDSFFVNPQGFENQSHVSTAEDLAKAAIYGLKNPIFAEIVSTYEYTAKSVDEKIIHKMKNLNTLLGKTEGVFGVKTGWTENAKENLVTGIERDGHKIIIVVLGSNDRFGETQKLIDWIYDSYSWNWVKV